MHRGKDQPGEHPEQPCLWSKQSYKGHFQAYDPKATGMVGRRSGKAMKTSRGAKGKIYKERLKELIARA